jgi:hypothetical protein
VPSWNLKTFDDHWTDLLEFLGLIR